MIGLYILFILLFITPLLSLAIRWIGFILKFLLFPLTLILKIKISLPTSLIETTNKIFGTWEYFIYAPRQFLGGLGLLIWIGLVVIPQVPTIPLGNLLLQIWFPLSLLGLIYFAHVQEVLSSLKVAEFLHQNPRMHPQAFFSFFRRSKGPFLIDLPDPSIQPTIDPQEISFKKNARPEQTYKPFFSLVWDTAHLAHLSLKSLRYVGPEYAREIFDIMACMWGKRFLELCQAHFTIQGMEKIQSLPGRHLLIFNHKSQLDFILTFFSLSQIRWQRGREVRPRFITAKDHFKDNILIYDILGVGRLIETVGMVFLERKKKVKGIQNLQEAAESLANKEIDIAIYPQGTRAEGNVDRSQKRRDAGYYTTVPRKDIQDDWGHLRKGTAFLALDGVKLMKDNEPLNLIFIGIKGTATLLSKGSLKAQTETDIEYVVGEPLTLYPEQVKDLTKPASVDQLQPQEQKYLDFIEELNHEIDRRLVTALDIHENLRQRFFVDLQGQFRFPADKIESILQCLDEFSKTSPIAYQILDRIYAASVQHWNSYLSELSQLLQNQRPLERFKVLRDEVTEVMLGKG